MSEICESVHLRGTVSELGYSRAVCVECGIDWPCPGVATARSQLRENAPLEIVSEEV